MQTLTGTGQDTLQGPTSDQTWNVTNPGAGNVDGTAFTGFAHLQSTAGNKDFFVFSQSGAIANGVDGGGLGTLVLTGNYQTLVSTPSDAHSGTITADGNAIRYSGMAPVKMGTAADTVFSLPDLSQATLTAAAGQPGFLTLSDPGFMETTTFADPTNSLTINLNGLNSGSLEVKSLDSGFKAALVLDTPGNNVGKNPLASAPDTSITIDDGVTISTNGLTAPAANAWAGQSVVINATTISIGNSVSINTTRSAGGTAGNVSIAGYSGSLQGPHSVTLGTGVTINAGTTGNITIAAIDDSYRVIEFDLSDYLYGQDRIRCAERHAGGAGCNFWQECQHHLRNLPTFRLEPSSRFGEIRSRRHSPASSNRFPARSFLTSCP